MPMMMMMPTGTVLHRQCIESCIPEAWPQSDEDRWDLGSRARGRGCRGHQLSDGASLLLHDCRVWLRTPCLNEARGHRWQPPAEHPVENSSL